MKLLLNYLSIFLMISLGITGYSQPSSWSPRGIGGGGGLFNPSINPGNPQEYYLSCDMSELFHTTDFGASYFQADFTQIISGAKVCFTNNGTQYTYTNNDDTGETFILKSTNNGLNWTTMNNPVEYEAIYYFFADYNNPNRIVIGYYGEIYFTSNGGSSYTKIHTNTDGNGSIIGGAFFDGNNIYLGTSDGLLVSTNGGTNFSMSAISGIPTDEKIISFSGARSGATTRLFCVTGNNGDVWAGITGGDVYDYMSNQGVYSVDYGSGNWQAKMTGITNGYGISYVGMAGNDVNTVYIGGVDANESYPLVMKSVNAGGNWVSVFNTNNNNNIATGWSGFGGDRAWSYGEYLMGFDVCQSDPNYLLITDLGFTHTSSSGGASWSQAYVHNSTSNPAGAATPKNKSYKSSGLENTSCWQLHWSDANNMFAAYTDIRGTRSTDGGNTWSFNFTGHDANTMYRIDQHPTNGTLFAGTSGIHDIYQSTYLADNTLDDADSQGKILYSTNKGAAWQLVHNFNHPVYWIALDKNTPTTAYASVVHSTEGGIFRTTNLQNLGSSTWTRLPVPPTTQGHPASIVVLNDGKVVCTYSGRRTDSGFTASSGTFIYDPALNSWTDVSDPGMRYWTKDIVVDPNDPTQNTWYVCVFSGWGGAPNDKGGIYRTTNRGSSWTKLSGSTFNRVNSLTFNPNNASQVYITTEYEGLWISNNITAATPTFSRVTNYPFKHPERVFFNPYNTSEVWITSFGNGMKMGALNVSTPVATITANDNVAAEPTATGQFTITLSPAPASNVTVNLTISGTATNGVDYTSIATTATVGTSGSTTITVTPIDDATAEGNETASITLATGAGYTTGIPGTATVTINDNEAANSVPSITTTTLPAGTVTTPYSQTLTATGGNGTLTWTVASGTLPTGLTLSTGGAITGTPTAAGTFNFTVRVADTDAINGAADEDTQALSIVINASNSVPTITTTILPGGTVTTPYSQALTATGGNGALVWSIASGALPAGLTLSTGGGITGTPTTAGTFNFTVRVADTDAINGAADEDTQALSIVINASNSVPTITTTTLPGGTVTTPYSQALAGTGGNGALAWTVASGTLPAGLTLSTAGAITGTPTTAGTSNFTVRVADSDGVTGAADEDTQALSIVINTSNSVPNITTTMLPSGTVTTPYEQTLAATGGNGTLKWNIASGALPAGLALSTGGVINGTPTAAGTYTFTVKVADGDAFNGAADEDTQALSIVINAGNSVPNITTTNLPLGKTGTPYEQALTATGGNGTLTWTVTSGTLPDGLTLSTTGAITGTPTTTGTFNFTVKVADDDAVNDAADEDNQVLSITILNSSDIITSVSPSLPTALNKKPSVHVYPNPSTGTISIRIDGATVNATIMIYDAVGKVVYAKKSVNENQTQISNLPSGMHVISVLNDGVYYKSKLLVE